MKNELMNFEVFDNSKEAENLMFKRKCSEIDITFKSRTDLRQPLRACKYWKVVFFLILFLAVGTHSTTNELIRFLMFVEH